MIYYLLIFLLFAAFMFWMQRKQRMAQSKVESMQRALEVGDQVVTMSGMYGTVVHVDDTTVDLEIAEDVVTTWLRQSIREVRPKTGNEHADIGEVAVEAESSVSTNGDGAALTTTDHRNDTSEADRD